MLAGAKLKELDLSDNALGPVGVEGMVEFMSSPVCYSLEVCIVYSRVEARHTVQYVIY